MLISVFRAVLLCQYAFASSRNNQQKSDTVISIEDIVTNRLSIQDIIHARINELELLDQKAENGLLPTVPLHAKYFQIDEDCEVIYERHGFERELLEGIIKDNLNFRVEQFVKKNNKEPQEALEIDRPTNLRVERSDIFEIHQDPLSDNFNVIRLIYTYTAVYENGRHLRSDFKFVNIPGIDGRKRWVVGRPINIGRMDARSKSALPGALDLILKDAKIFLNFSDSETSTDNSDNSEIYGHSRFDSDDANDESHITDSDLNVTLPIEKANLKGKRRIQPKIIMDDPKPSKKHARTTDRKVALDSRSKRSPPKNKQRERKVRKSQNDPQDKSDLVDIIFKTFTQVGDLQAARLKALEDEEKESRSVQLSRSTKSIISQIVTMVLIVITFLLQKFVAQH